MSHFCTCTDRTCPLNPANHSKGCDLCIQKCLKLGKFPAASSMLLAAGRGRRPIHTRGLPGLWKPTRTASPLSPKLLLNSRRWHNSRAGGLVHHVYWAACHSLKTGLPEYSLAIL